MSAFGGKADIVISERDVCFWPKAEVEHRNLHGCKKRRAPNTAARISLYHSKIVLFCRSTHGSAKRLFCYTIPKWICFAIAAKPMR
jgi:hypothetical protein